MKGEEGKGVEISEKGEERRVKGVIQSSFSMNLRV